MIWIFILRTLLFFTVLLFNLVSGFYLRFYVWLLATDLEFLSSKYFNILIINIINRSISFLTFWNREESIDCTYLCIELAAYLHSIVLFIFKAVVPPQSLCKRHRINGSPCCLTIANLYYVMYYVHYLYSYFLKEGLPYVSMNGI